jgi:putative acetyltransferase
MFGAVPEGEISIDDPRTEDVRELLERHLAFANSRSLPEDVHALDVDGLLDPAVMFVSFRRGGELLGIAAGSAGRCSVISSALPAIAAICG